MEKGSEASSKLPSIIYMLLCLQVRKHGLFQKIIMQWRSSNQDRTNDILKNTRKLHEQPVSQTFPLIQLNRIQILSFRKVWEVCKGKFNLFANLSFWRRGWQPTPVLAWRIPMDRGAWWATVRGVAKSQTRLKD